VNLRGTSTRFDRALLIRHFAIAAAALAAFFLRFQLRAGNGVLWVLGVAAVLNLSSFHFTDRPLAGRFARIVSPFISVICWTVLIHLTGGVASPFTPGFWLEIALSALSLSLPATTMVALSTVIALWIQQAFIGLPGSTTSLLVQSGFLLLVGGVTFLLTHRAMRAQRVHSEERVALQERLGALERELTDVRLVGRVGENAAQLAHGMKNAVHSLRGFVSLIEPKLDHRDATKEALEGLRCAIDHLEELARVSLHTEIEGAPGAVRIGGCETQAAIDQIASEMSAAYPQIRWEKPADSKAPPVAASPTVLREVLLILLHNAAEAMGGRGLVRIETSVSDDLLRIRVRDHGCGVPSEKMQRIFDPGFTTKPDGSGLGLYLAKKLLMAHGGEIAAERSPEGGAVFSLALPVVRT
jgi:signal transduction histidine kinase